MSLPAYETGRADEAERAVYCILSTLTTRLHTELAINELGAFGRWTRHHDINARGHAGKIRQNPFQHAELRLQTESGLEIVAVVAEPVLEARGGLLDLLDLGDLPGGDRHG